MGVVQLGVVQLGVVQMGVDPHVELYTPPPLLLYCIHYQLAPPLMSQTRVIDLSAINKNLSIRFRAKFGKQSEGSISNYLRAISLARIYPIIWHQQELLPKKVKGRVRYVLKISSPLSHSSSVIRKCGLCDNFDQSCDHMGGGRVISQAEIECHHIGRAPFITSMGGLRRSP